MAGGGVVGFCGGRSVPPGCPLVAPVVAAVLRAGRSVAVGCSVGADAAVLSAVVAQGAVARCQVFAAFGPGGVGACSLSAVGPVSLFFASGGAVSWWAGGPVSVPLQARLVRRSQGCWSVPVWRASWPSSPPPLSPLSLLPLLVALSWPASVPPLWGCPWWPSSWVGSGLLRPSVPVPGCLPPPGVPGPAPGAGSLLPSSLCRAGGWSLLATGT